MKRPSKIQVFVFMTISFFVLVFSTDLYYSNLAEVNLFHTDLSFETPGQENSLADQQNESKVFLSSVFSILFLLRANLSRQADHFSFQTSSLDQKATILRC